MYTKFIFFSIPPLEPIKDAVDNNYSIFVKKNCE